MSAEAWGRPPDDHVDSPVDMTLRRAMSGEFAEEPVDFYTEACWTAQDYFGPPEENDEPKTWLDVGCNSGEFALQAKRATRMDNWRVIGLDPYDQPYLDFFRDFPPDDIDPHDLTFIKGVGEDIPLPDDAVSFTTAHNVLFRAADLEKMFSEMMRVTERNGLIGVSTNFEGHAFYRHWFQRRAAIRVSRLLRVPLDKLLPPAHGSYMDDLPRLVRRIGGLSVIDRVVQETESRITRANLGAFLYSLYLSANRLPNDTEIPSLEQRLARVASEHAHTIARARRLRRKILGHEPEAEEKPAPEKPELILGVRQLWRVAIDAIALPPIDNHLTHQEAWLQRQGRDPAEAYYSDPVHRGLLVLRNEKPYS